MTTLREAILIDALARAEAAERALATLREDVAREIEGELICCDVFDRLKDKPSVNWTGLERSEYRHHAICYWGTAAARIARGAR